MCPETSSVEMFMFSGLHTKTRTGRNLSKQCDSVRVEIYQKSVTEMPIFYNYAFRCRTIKRFSSSASYGGQHLNLSITSP